MELKMYAEKIHSLKTDCDIFLKENKEAIIEFMRKKDITAEENLEKEILFELLDAVNGICHAADYMAAEVTAEGFLGRDQNGEITFENKVLPLMSEIEVYLYDEDAGMDVWTRVFVGGKEKRYLVGIGKDYDIIGLKARMRIN